MAEPIFSGGGPATGTTGLPTNVAAGLCAIFTLVGGVVFYFIEKRDTFVRHWAVQSIFFGGTWFAFNILLTIVITVAASLPGLHLILVPLLLLVQAIVHLGFFVLWLIGIIKAFQGDRWEYPYISAQCRRLFPNVVA
ncbi:MAG: DUF4870 domain-containing protein [Verrucomicrobia bacterium]|nr:DUF4870 domain-containing protein [Verrucomicrobiota bacterium]